VTSIRIAIMSDIHADENDNGDTRIFPEPPLVIRRQFPMSDLDQLIASNNLTADYLLLPGDTANRANADGLRYGWRRAHAVATALGARLIATAGNHDVVTRSPSSDKWSLLKGLLPSFPSGDLAIDRQYWEKGWCVVEEADHRILVLDSTADFPDYPAANPTDDAELEHYFAAINKGGLKANVEDDIEDYFANAPAKLNIAIVHHHPLEHQIPDFLRDSYGAMRRGGELVQTLTNTHRAGRWLIIHGHKHIPQLASATSVSANGPIVLCAGSLGAKIWDPVNTVARNQFHILEMESDPNSSIVGLAGSIESYTWGMGMGWYFSERKGSGLPGRAGFGNAVAPRDLLSRIDRVVPSLPGHFMRYEDLLAHVPELPYVMPLDEDALESMAPSFGLSIMRGKNGQIDRVARGVL